MAELERNEDGDYLYEGKVYSPELLEPVLSGYDEEHESEALSEALQSIEDHNRLIQEIRASEDQFQTITGLSDVQMERIEHFSASPISFEEFYGPDELDDDFELLHDSDFGESALERPLDESSAAQFRKIQETLDLSDDNIVEILEGEGKKAAEVLYLFAANSTLQDINSWSTEPEDYVMALKGTGTDIALQAKLILERIKEEVREDEQSQLSAMAKHTDMVMDNWRAEEGKDALNSLTPDSFVSKVRENQHRNGLIEKL